jgi:hypothetical protein
MYFLPKIHKPDNPGRPIVSACGCPTELISSFLDCVMAPLVKEGLLWGPRSPLLCATLCDIRRHWQFSKKGSMRRWAKLGDIERHWATLGDIGQNWTAISRH